MKVSSLILSLVLMCTLSACGKDKNVASNALSGCVLDEPIEAKATNKKEIYYDQVVTDQGEAKAFSFFMIRNWNEDSGFMGGALWEKSGQRYGFANSYSGNMNIHQETQEIQGVQVLTTTERDSDDSVVNELKVAFQDEKLLGVSLTYHSGVGSKTVCVKSMKPGQKPTSNKATTTPPASEPASQPEPTPSAKKIKGPNFAAQVQEAADLGYFYPDLSDAKTYWYFPLSIKKKLTRPIESNDKTSTLYYYGSFDIQSTNILKFAHLKGISPDNIQLIVTGNFFAGYCDGAPSLGITAPKGYDSIDPNVRLEFRSSSLDEVKRAEAGALKSCFVAVTLGKDQNIGMAYLTIGL